MTDNPTLPLVERLRADAHMIQELANEDGDDPRLTIFGFSVLYNSLSKAANALEAAQRRVSELEKQRLMILAAVYAEAPKFVATICDTSLDRSGALLGEVRDLARAALAKDETARE